MRTDNDEPNRTKIPFTSREVKHQCVANLIHWMLSTNFLSFFIFSCIVFITSTFVFALIIMAITFVEPKCVTSNIFESSSEFPAGFNDAFSLSWTTFSTVGYGVISPSTSTKFQDQMDRFDDSGGCAFMSIILSFEALVGILFVSYAGAIMYVKLIQFQSNAQVAFSNVILVKYGKGVEAADVDDDSSVDSEDEAKQMMNKIPFPVLIFRLVNLLNSTKNGEIVEAHVNTVATVNLKNAVMSHITRGNTVFKDALSSEMTNKVQGKRAYSYIDKPKRPVGAGTLSDRSIGHFMSNRRFGRSNNSIQPPKSFGYEYKKGSSSIRSIPEDSIHVDLSLRKSLKVKNAMFHYGMSHEQVNLTKKDVIARAASELTVPDNESEEYGIGLLPPGLGMCVMHKESQVEMPNMVFAKVEMDPVSHPYFRTSWRIAHTLNEESPLLKKEVRKKIIANGGTWPAELNNCDAIEDSIDFDQFLVSFKGISKSTGTDVYSHHVYTKEDLRIGYQFKSILVSNANGSLGIVPEDIDEIKAQYGGII